ncbi:OsmC family protein [Muricauda sp. CAU 1633]|uniref:OsmC family protein n=1 Tax=Allomuricauda sp. CAU 1633 TaxID=2816036 RepID=UPI001A905407|nr:OsmC family protein [Muricauda sp. CAU 1633]MBO0324023.1 OsmC family protein [Muricauda sp. CAU 1633]
MTSKITYNGELRTTCLHVRSGNEFITDAPVDNAGKGEAFSPTDTVATALASCMLTTMAIKAPKWEEQLVGATVEITKHMVSNPRRISKIEVKLELSAAIDEDGRKELEHIAHTCPVQYCLHPDIERVIDFHWIK